MATNREWSQLDETGERKSNAERVKQFLETIRARNRREITVGLILLPVFAILTLTAARGTAEFYGHLLIFLGILFVVGMMKFVAAPRGDLKANPASDVLYWQSEIRRQAKLLRLVPFWYLLPLVPGMLLVIGSTPRSSRFVSILIFFIWAAIFAFIAWLNRKAAESLERDADALSSAATSRSSRPYSKAM